MTPFGHIAVNVEQSLRVRRFQSDKRQFSLSIKCKKTKRFLIVTKEKFPFVVQIPASFKPLLIEGEFLSDNGIQEVRLNGIKILGTIQGSPTNPTFYNTKTAVHLFNNTLEFFVTNDTDSFTGFESFGNY